jgi:DNA-binding transcriptional LysR family regulator
MKRAVQIGRRLKLRQLEILSAVAECGTMGKAAQRLAVSQPVVSKAIADLEHTLSVRLLDRSAQGVEPTTYGRALLKWSAAAFDNLRQGVKEIEFLSDPTAGDLRIGCGGAMVEGILPVILLRLRQQHPRLTFHVTQANTRSVLYRELRERNVDLVMGRIILQDIEDDLNTETLFDEPLLVVASHSNPLARRRRIQLAELLDESWVLPGDGAARVTIAETFAAGGLAVPHADVVYASIHMHRALLVSGRFVSMMPASVVRFGSNDRSLKVLPVKLPALPRPVGVITLKNRMISPIVEGFTDRAREVAKWMMKKR